MTYNHKPITTAQCKNMDNTKCCQGYEPLYTISESIKYNTLENIWKAYQETKHIPSPRATLLRGVYPKEKILSTNYVQDCS